MEDHNNKKFNSDGDALLPDGSSGHKTAYEEDYLRHSQEYGQERQLYDRTPAEGQGGGYAGSHPTYGTAGSVAYGTENAGQAGDLSDLEEKILQQTQFEEEHPEEAAGEYIPSLDPVQDFRQSGETDRSYADGPERYASEAYAGGQKRDASGAYADGQGRNGTRSYAGGQERDANQADADGPERNGNRSYADGQGRDANRSYVDARNQYRGRMYGAEGYANQQGSAAQQSHRVSSGYDGQQAGRGSSGYDGQQAGREPSGYDGQRTGRGSSGFQAQQPQRKEKNSGTKRSSGRPDAFTAPHAQGNSAAEQASAADEEAARLQNERKRLEKERKLLEKERKKTEAASRKAAKARKKYETAAQKRGRAGRRHDGAAGPAYDPYTGKKLKPYRKKHPVRRFFLTILLVLILALALWIAIQVHTMQSMGMDTQQIENSIADSVKKSIASGGAQSNFKNVAILGVDSVDNSLDSGNNRSDVMIIASINNKTGAIRLMSLYRDTYLDIGDGNYQKANAAYAFGGPEQTMQMMNRNLDLDITDYGVVGFEGIARLIDAMGGVEIDVQEDEIVHLNNYQLTMSEETGLTNIPVTQAGVQTLNGLQATAYCRIRYTNGNDFRRTERQRTVLTKTFEKIKSNPLRLVMHLNSILPYVKTSLSIPEMFSLGAQALRFNVESQEGFPSQDMLTVGYINQQSCVIPITLAKNVTWLHSELFGETDYEPSQTVQDISSYISSVTGYY